MNYLKKKNSQGKSTILLYEQGIIAINAAIEQLKTHTLFDQLSFHTEKALENLRLKKIITMDNLQDPEKK